MPEHYEYVRSNLRDVIERINIGPCTSKVSGWYIDDLDDDNKIDVAFGKMKDDKPESEIMMCDIKRITGCSENIEIVDINNLQPGHLAYISSAYTNGIYMVYSVGSDGFSMIRANGDEEAFSFNRCYNKISITTFVPSKSHIEWFLEEIKRNIESPYDSYNLVSIIGVIKEKYPEEYKKLDIPVCSVCGEVAIPKIVKDGETFCGECYDKIYTTCCHCHNSVKRIFASKDRNGYYLCPDCNKRHWVLPYHNYYPAVKFYGDNKNNSVPFMGFELEVDCGGESNRNVAQIMPLINKEDTGDIFAYCSRDGSLDDGFEIITQPATMQYHSSIRDIYNRVSQKLKTMGYASHETTTCGFHVHFNRSFFDKDEEACIERLLYITEKFWNELCVFARRPERRMERYSKRVSKDMMLSEYVKCANCRRDHSYHYYSVNITNPDTIEIRIFRGTLNINTIMATLQLVNNMAVCAKTKTMDDIKDMKFSNLLTTPTQRKYWGRRSAVMDFEE